MPKSKIAKQEKPKPEKKLGNWECLDNFIVKTLLII